MNHGGADVLRSLLVDLGHVTVPGAGGDWPAYLAYEPSSQGDAPDELVTLYDTAPLLFGRHQPTGSQSRHFGVQVRARSQAYYDGWNKVEAIRGALALVSNAAVSVGDQVGTGSADYVVQAITLRSGPVHIRPTNQPHEHELFTLNVTAAIRQTT